MRPGVRHRQHGPDALRPVDYGKGQRGRPQRAAGVQGGAAVGLRPLPPARCRRGGAAARGQSAVIAVQKLSQAASNGHLGFAVDGAASFQAREIGPADARVDTRVLKSPALLAGVVCVQARNPGAHPRPLRPSRRRPGQSTGRACGRRRLLPARTLLRPRLCGRRAPRLVALRRRPRRPRRRCRLVRVVGMMNDELLDSSFIAFSPARRRGGRSRA